MGLAGRNEIWVLHLLVSLKQVEETRGCVFPHLPSDFGGEALGPRADLAPAPRRAKEEGPVMTLFPPRADLFTQPPGKDPNEGRKNADGAGPYRLLGQEDDQHQPDGLGDSPGTGDGGEKGADGLQPPRPTGTRIP